MVDGEIFENSAEFCEWFRKLNPDEPLDMTEAMNIFFNLDIYENLGAI